MQKVTCIIIEDRQIDMEYLRCLVEQQDILELKGCFNNPLEANAFIQQHAPRLIFMDIDMPVMNGIDYFKKLSPQPICIFVTAFSEHAWESYELHAFDFILKPVKIERFETCIKRLKEYLELLSRSDIYESHVGKNTITIKEGTTKHIIDINDILYIEALKDYSKVVTSEKKIMTLSKLKHFMEKLPGNEFVRIHRSYAVAVQKVSKINGNDIYIQSMKLPVGKTFKSQLSLLK
ncbi:DNA-binding response regulator [Terrimonas sp.]|uniref:LytR/AlgR family response regulator transcription factor n=1 Tax=Terrimonas sp. TaxID=1914338 RepID=UPI000D50CC64|nr:LytTR family DNA-binding domain-containing protein [Terrimonas sp.]PVD49463.1 DNA-binding response regulator [Terrimonas sp.]